ncbi:short-subunit dehydrogenase [Aequitasia blattaphilus]|uniref:NADP-dependent 3-hydroxy acid dehydrogenase YdfG n=1 Tax=Aequitasia blattaphilus TaxID=2949332 RepID=A0ABT1E9A5_9FIRM|nr:SDR family NAD(P)-dependent oxidoreductase [Aequitasia blattaphilus]MCP1101092.1 SDR family NAD(P)-dependent oxidoreductase [Aequitasia blattaphilus]MCR8613732.1 SDR family NAD(P)-dependent oxidoreductase [Aequitasia blattaphilus]
MNIAIVTGASSGLGREFVRQIESVYKNIDEIWVIARRKERLEKLKMRSRVTIHVLDGDLTQENIYERLAYELRTKGARVRMLVNASGFGKYGLISSLETKDMLGMIDVNCKSLTKMTLVCLPYMSRGSRIIQVASAAAFTPQPKFTIYAATKAYVLRFSLGLREELKKKGIWVTTLCPGPVKTEFFQVAGPAQKLTKEEFMSEAEEVVRRGLIASIEKKPLCVFGPFMKAFYVASSIFPDTLTAKALQLFNN